MPKHPLAVGYTITNDIKFFNDLIDKKLGPDSHLEYNVEEVTQTGVLFSCGCPGVGSSNASATEGNMNAWYKSKGPRPKDGIIKKIWIVEKPRVIVCEVIIGKDRFYSVISKPHTRIQTTGIKKAIINNQYGEPIEQTIKITGTPYIYQV